MTDLCPSSGVIFRSLVSYLGVRHSVQNNVIYFDLSKVGVIGCNYVEPYLLTDARIPSR